MEETQLLTHDDDLLDHQRDRNSMDRVYGNIQLLKNPNISFPVPKGQTKIGRDPEQCQIVLESKVCY